jgi:hypothetical protein
MVIRYEKLTPDEFDAVVTGELTHSAIWFEDRFNEFLISYLGILKSRSEIFTLLFLYREGLRFQDKIEISEAIIRHHNAYLTRPGPKQIDVSRALRLFGEIKKLKTVRNALAHGLAVQKSDKSATPMLHVQTIGRSGKKNETEITPSSHKDQLQQLDKLHAELDSILRADETRLWNHILSDMEEEVETNT